MRQLAQDLTSELQKAISAGGVERIIVNNFVNAVRSLSPGKIPGGTVRIRSGFTHAKPMVFFVKPKVIQGATRTELGDILFVVKRRQRGVLKERRAVFLQARLAHGGSIRLESHQHEFQRTFARTQFEFGKECYKVTHFKPQVWLHPTWSKWVIANLILFRPQPQQGVAPPLVCCAHGIHKHVQSHIAAGVPSFQVPLSLLAAATASSRVSWCACLVVASSGSRLRRTSGR